MLNLRRHLLPLTCLTLVAACEGTGPDWSSEQSSVAPAGADAALISHTIPVALAPGERRAVQIVMGNVGSIDWPLGQMALVPTDRQWGWPIRIVSQSVVPGGSATFSFVITAPLTAGPHNLTAEMYSLLPGEQGGFGTRLSIVVNVDNALTPEFACAPVAHTLPASFTPGERRRVTMTVRNAGTATWPADGSFCLYQRDGTPGSLPTPLNNRWGGTYCTPVTQPVAPGATVDFDIDVDAPTVGGTYTFRRQMFYNSSPAAGGVGFFDANQHCFDLTTTVNGSLQFDASVRSHTLLPKMDPGGFAWASVTLQNTGTDPWPADGSLLLHSVSAPIGLFGRNATVLTTEVLPGETTQVFLPVQAPASPGTYEQAWQMFNSSGQYFGEVLRVATTVATPPPFDADIHSLNLPSTMVAQATFSGLVEVRNRGTGTWPADGTFGLEYIGLPADLWGPSFVALTTPIGPGEIAQFSLPIQAPDLAGGYRHRWRMVALGSPFGDTLDRQVIVFPAK